ncbi:nucleotide sugar dehydrogenase [Halopenitus sp. H-Gu1]|uniref:nucleotide sugar dehydrogenase n=1 Tax=Halopenitus sp. H-Gu1 TaxID=3242697 RepID=UPI00359D9827
MSASNLVARLANRDAKIGVIGLGYVGLPLSVEFAAAGFDVVGFDIDADRVERLQQADSYVDDVSDADISDALDAGFTPNDDPSAVADCDAYVIAVPTGIANGEPRLESIEAAARTIADQRDERETLVVVSSTVYPGATQEVVAPIVIPDGTDKNNPADAPTRLAMVPERLNPGSDHEIADIPLVIGADDEPARRAATELFDAIVEETVPVSNAETAELTKTLENTYRMVNIALVNQLVDLADVLEADVWEAIDAAATKPFGFQPFRPGPGVGGHCIPVDPQFLTWRAREKGTEIPLIERSHEVNESMPEKVIEDVLTALRARGVEPEEARVLALGASYKPNVGDARNSPAIDVVTGLADHASVTVVDPHVPAGDSPLPLELDLDAIDLDAIDAVVLLVDHDAFDLDALGERASFVYDSRNAMPEETNATVLTLGDRHRIDEEPRIRR